jgi:hypothetical protein
MNDIQQEVLRNAYDELVQRQEAARLAQAHLNNVILAIAGGPAKLDRDEEGKFHLTLAE